MESSGCAERRLAPQQKTLGREYNAFSSNKHSQPWTIAGEEA